eukprot:Gb_09858 [translate_table: standard]
MLDGFYQRFRETSNMSAKSVQSLQIRNGDGSVSMSTIAGNISSTNSLMGTYNGEDVAVKILEARDQCGEGHGYGTSICAGSDEAYHSKSLAKRKNQSLPLKIETTNHWMWPEDIGVVRNTVQVQSEGMTPETNTY